MSIASSDDVTILPSSAARRHVALVVVTHNSASELPSCLATMPAELDGADVSLTIVDNHSTDGTVELARALAPEAHLLAIDRNHGYAAGLNAAAATLAHADALLVVNPDARLAPGCVDALLEALARPRTGIAVPRVLGSDGRLVPSLRRESTIRRALGEALLGGGRAGRVPWCGETVTEPSCYERPTLADTASGAVMMLSRRCYDDLGPWDESFRHGSEETEFCLRARDRGWLLRYAPAAVVTHAGGSSERSPVLRPLMFCNRLELYRRRHGAALAVPFRFALALNEALRCHRGPQHRATLRALLGGRRPTWPGD